MNAFYGLLARPLVYWFAVPFVVTLGLFLGITSAAAEGERAQPPLATPTNTPTLAPTRPGLPPAPRPSPTPTRPAPQVQTLAGRITAFDPRSMAIIVQTRANKILVVYIQPATVARLGDTRIRLRDMQLGDVVTVLGKRTPTGAFNAALITVKPRVVPR